MIMKTSKMKKANGPKAIIATFVAAIMILSVLSLIVSDADSNTDSDFGTYSVDIPLGSEVEFSGAMVSAGDHHSLALKEDGTVWAWGRNGYGQLGDGTNAGKNRPVRVEVASGVPLTGVTAISAGDFYSLALTDDGRVWAWGYNNSSQLGDGTNTDRNRPACVEIAPDTPLTGVTAISAGNAHSLALKNDGTVWAWGYNYYGQLGNGVSGTGARESRPVCVEIAPDTPLTGVTAISAGNAHSLALKNDGTVWAWGYNNSSQLGDGTNTDRNRPVCVEIAPDTPLTGVTAISAGGFHSLALTDDCKVWAWGYNDRGQLGDGTDGTANNKNRPVLVETAPDTPLTGV
ncbi:MAG: hypothetical protein FWD81_04410, partial [Methanomassiliicoccaceae archaeon]|nr:hypothetical protein [Methanomassiliicoccaceae archaeon]